MHVSKNTNMHEISRINVGDHIRYYMFIQA